jgi:hypothetical protein
MLTPILTTASEKYCVCGRPHNEPLPICPQNYLNNPEYAYTVE